MPRPGSKAFYGHQRDGNEDLLVEVAERCGKFVTRVKSSNPPGAPDLIVITPSVYVPVYVAETPEQMQDICALDEPIALVEVKEPGGKLNKNQVKWHGDALGLPEEQVTE